MRFIENFQQVEVALSKFVPSGPLSGNYTLDVMKQLMTYLGNPQNELKVIHIAGTSGKTSTAYYVTSLLNAAGHTTGLSVSPHITQINERAQIDLLPLPEREYCMELGEFLDLVDASGLDPSHFEVMVGFAYWLFHKRGVEYAVIEVGLGGLLDGTNVIDRSDKVCVITDIGFDHTDILGNTLGKIAAQKAGIIHAHNDVYMYEQSTEVMTVVGTVCRDNEANLHVVEQNKTIDEVDLPTFQQRNFWLAKQTVDRTLQRDGHAAVTDDQAHRAAQIYIPGRMDITSQNGKTLIMDGAHNEQKIAALIEAIKKQFPDVPMTLLVSFGQNKQTTVEQSLVLLRQLGQSIIITKFKKGQDEMRAAIDPEELAGLAREAGFTSITVESDPFVARELLNSTDTDVNLIVGSFYLIEMYKKAT